MDEWLRSDQLPEFLKTNGAWLDVRAPIEFGAGQLPNSINLPILNDEERAAVGALYKKSGQAAAIELGHALVTGETKSKRIQAWREALEANPSMLITCARGGMRSQLTQAWLREVGMERRRVHGGVKQVRQFYITSMERLALSPFWTLAGPTGSGKTLLLQQIQQYQLTGSQAENTLDLEALAQHRGSAFGPTATPQPAQSTFENQISHRLLSIENLIDSKPLLVEDESRMIGRLVLPPSLHKTILESPMVLIDEPIDKRVENTYTEYVEREILGDGLRNENGDDDESARDNRARETFKKYRAAIDRISNRLGGARASELKTLIQEAEDEFLRTGRLDHSRVWVERLLTQYYDPLYQHSLKNRTAPEVFRGSLPEAFEFLVNRPTKL